MIESNILELIVGTAFLGWNAYLHNKLNITKLQVERICTTCEYDYIPKKTKSVVS